MTPFASFIEDFLAHHGLFFPEAGLESLIRVASQRSDCPERLDIETEESYARRFTYYLIAFAFPASEEEHAEAREALRLATLAAEGVAA